MKTLKTIFSVLTFVAIIPCFAMVIIYHQGVDGMADYILKLGAGATSTYLTIRRIKNALRVLCLLIIPFFVSAGIVGITTKKKFYSGLISGSIPLVTYLWFLFCKLSIDSLDGDAFVEHFEYFDKTYTSNLSRLPITLFFVFVAIPMIGNLIVGIIQIIKVNRRMKAGLPLEDPEPKVIEDTPTVNPVPTGASLSAAEEIKQMKELLDMGILTPQEFEAKKKQLLGLPTTNSAPIVSQCVGKCLLCGRENVPLESIEVVVAGVPRKRAMCSECANKYK